MRHISFLFPFLTTFVSVVINCGVTAAVFLHSGLVVPNHNAINRKHHKVNIWCTGLRKGNDKAAPNYIQSFFILTQLTLN